MADALEREWKGDPSELGPALDWLMRTAMFRALATGAAQDGDFEEVLRWSRREVAVYSPILTNLDRMFSSARLNMAFALRQTGQPNEAAGLLQQVYTQAADPTHKSAAAINLAKLLMDFGGDHEQVVALAQAAREIAPYSARMKEDAYTLEAMALMSRADYPRAEEALATGLAVTLVSGDRARRANFLLLTANVQMLKGDVVAARTALRNVIADSDTADTSLAASVRIEVVRHCRNQPEYADIVEESRRWLEEHLAGLPPDDPRVIRYRELD